MRLLTHKRETRVFGLPLRSVLIHLAISIGALFVAAKVVRGIYLDGWQAAVLAGAIFGLINLAIKAALGRTTTVLKILSLGLFAVLVNVAALAATSWIAEQTTDIHFHVDGFAALFVGALLISVLSALASLLVDEA